MKINRDFLTKYIKDEFSTCSMVMENEVIWITEENIKDINIENDYVVVYNKSGYYDGVDLTIIDKNIIDYEYHNEYGIDIEDEMVINPNYVYSYIFLKSGYMYGIDTKCIYNKLKTSIVKYIQQLDIGENIYDTRATLNYIKKIIEISQELNKDFKELIGESWDNPVIVKFQGMETHITNREITIFDENDNTWGNWWLS